MPLVFHAFTPFRCHALDADAAAFFTIFSPLLLPFFITPFSPLAVAALFDDFRFRHFRAGRATPIFIALPPPLRWLFRYLLRWRCLLTHLRYCFCCCRYAQRSAALCSFAADYFAISPLPLRFDDAITPLPMLLLYA
jgi:hypothetical protein